MKQPTLSGWLHRLLCESGPEQDDRELSARAQQARADAQRWLAALREEHQRQLVERRERTASEPSEPPTRNARRHGSCVGGGRAG